MLRPPSAARLDPNFDFDDIPRWDGTRFELGHVLDAVLHATAA